MNRLSTAYNAARGLWTGYMPNKTARAEKIRARLKTRDALAKIVAPNPTEVNPNWKQDAQHASLNSSLDGYFMNITDGEDRATALSAFKSILTICSVNTILIRGRTQFKIWEDHAHMHLCFHLVQKKTETTLSVSTKTICETLDKALGTDVLYDVLFSGADAESGEKDDAADYTMQVLMHVKLRRRSSIKQEIETAVATST